MDVVPFHFPGDTVTCHAEAAVTGGRFVAPSGPRVDGNYQVSHATAGAPTLGVASRDKAAGEKVMVFTRGIVGVTAAVALTAGQSVQSDAAGQATPLTDAGAAAPFGVAGIVLEDAAAGAVAIIKLNG